MPFAVAAHVQLARYRSVFGRILREEAHPIGCCEVKPLQERSIFNHRGSGQRKIHAAIEKLPRGPRGVVEGGLDLGDWYDVCAAPLMAVFTPVVPVPRVGVLSCPEILRPEILSWS